MTSHKRVKSGNRYPDEFKRKLAQEYLSGRFSYAVAAEEYGLKDKRVVREFVKWYLKKSELSPTNESVPMKKVKPSSEELNLEERIKQLESDLRMSKLKVEALETMIDIAEDQLKIDIRKKSGTQQSKK
jgi:transposase-like protein